MLGALVNSINKKGTEANAPMPFRYCIKVKDYSPSSASFKV